MDTDIQIWYTDSGISNERSCVFFMICQTISLPRGGSMSLYVPDPLSEVDPGKTFPCVVLCPGGGYAFTSVREAEPLALRFLAREVACAVVYYTCHPEGHYPQQLLQVCQAMQILRDRAGEWHLQSENFFVMGFSAGGHLAASVGNGWNSAAVKAELGETVRPRGMILCYPVITSGDFAHKDSFKCLLGDKWSEEEAKKHSQELLVNADTPPAFLWHTYADELVPVENSLMMASALRRAGIPFEMHIYPDGGHGLSLCDEFVGTPFPHNDGWMDLCIQWVLDGCAPRN